jgi:NAD(P)H-flavin reductase
LQWPASLTALCHALADWERGACDILIKIYRDGAATSWLQQQPLGSQVWLSQPMKTLAVPSLVLDSSRMSNSAVANHEGVLLVLAGTGVVAAAQVPQ